MPPRNAQLMKQVYQPVDCPNGCSKHANKVVTESKSFQYAMCDQCKRLLSIFTTDGDPQMKMIKQRG